MPKADMYMKLSCDNALPIFGKVIVIAKCEGSS